MFVRLLVATILMAAFTLQAQESQNSAPASEVISQPGLYEFRFLAAPSYTTSTRQVTWDGSGGYTREVTNSEFFLGGEYGFSEAYSMGLSTSWGETDSKYSNRDFTYHSTGMSDLVLNGKYRLVGQGSLLLAWELSLSPDQETLATRSVTGNRYSGGHSLTPRMAYEQIFGKTILGGNVSYSLKGTRRSKVIGASGTEVEKIETKGGNVLAGGPYIEYKTDGFSLGLHEKLLYVEPSKETSSVDEDTNWDSMLYLDSMLYSNIRLQERWDLRPSFVYRTVVNRDVNGITYGFYDTFTFEVLSRMTF